MEHKENLYKNSKNLSHKLTYSKNFVDFNFPLDRYSFNVNCLESEVRIINTSPITRTIRSTRKLQYCFKKLVDKMYL